MCNLKFCFLGFGLKRWPKLFYRKLKHITFMEHENVVVELYCTVNRLDKAKKGLETSVEKWLKRLKPLKL